MEGGISRKFLALLEVLAGLAAALLAFLVLLIFNPRTWVWYTLLWLIGLAFVLAAFLYLPLLYLTCRYTLTSEYLEFRGGIFFHSQHRMPRSSIMYVTVVRSPVSYLCRTRTLIIRSMGGSIVIPMVPLQSAEKLLTVLGEARQ